MVSDVHCGVGRLIFCIAVCARGSGRAGRFELDMYRVGIGVGIGVGIVGFGVGTQVGRWDHSRRCRCRRLDVWVQREEDGAVGISTLVEVVKAFLLQQ